MAQLLGAPPSRGPGIDTGTGTGADTSGQRQQVRRLQPGAGEDGGGSLATPGAQGYVPAPFLSRWVFPPHSQEVFLAPRPPQRQGSAGEGSLVGTWTFPALLLEAARKFKALPAPPSRTHSRERASTPSFAPPVPHPHHHIYQSGLLPPVAARGTWPFLSGFVSPLSRSKLLADPSRTPLGIPALRGGPLGLNDDYTLNSQ